MYQLTERDQKEGFWYHRPSEGWPPAAVETPDAYEGGPRLLFSCTGKDSRERRNRIRVWVEALPLMTNVRFLWVTGTLNQDLLKGICNMPSLEGLWAKNSNVESLDTLWAVDHLRFVSINNGARIRSIAGIGRARHLLWLELENAKLIRDLGPIAHLTKLKGLAIRGSMWRTQVVESLSPLGGLADLRYLGIENLRSRDGSLRPLFALRELRHFAHALWWPADELATIRSHNPGLGG